MQITVKGLASNNTWTFPISEEEMEMILMDFLRKKQMMIASSCSGAGICRKCIIQDDILTCVPTVKEFLQSRHDGIVIVSYL